MTTKPTFYDISDNVPNGEVNLFKREYRKALDEMVEFAFKYRQKKNNCEPIAGKLELAIDCITGYEIRANGLTAIEPNIVEAELLDIGKILVDAFDMTAATNIDGLMLESAVNDFVKGLRDEMVMYHGAVPTFIRMLRTIESEVRGNPKVVELQTYLQPSNLQY